MPRYLYSPLCPRFYSKTLIQIILVLALAWVAVILYRKWFPKKEGFTQMQKFVMKRGDGANDAFYAEVYDQLYQPEKRVPFELKTILSLTQASDYSVFLDVGSGTGYLVNELTNLGYQAYGIDKSADMVTYSEKKYPETIVKHGDILDAMNYESSTFSHILCMNSTLYHFQDKVTFFRNCHSWLKPGGHLILHLVEPKKMNAAPPSSPVSMFLRENQTVDSIINYDEFKYKVAYTMASASSAGNLRSSGRFAPQPRTPLPYINSSSSGETVKTETFYDIASGNVRQNEQTMYYTNLQDILSIANYSGFTPEGKVDMSEFNGDSYQYIYVLRRI